MKLRIATRRSALALVQSNFVASLLKQHEPSLEVELVEVVTTGDRIQNVALSAVGGKGLFVSEVEDVLLRGEAEVAVHSLKDVPAELAPGLTLGAIPEREDPRDVLVTAEGEQLDDLEAGARIGTSSLRRSLQLRRQRNDLEYALLRGNVDTRLRKLADGEYRAIVLAAAGLRRLGLFERPLWPIPVEISVPAVGQGALAIEAREDDARTLALLHKIDHAQTRACVLAERAFLAALGGDCHTPLGGHAQLVDEGRRVRFEGWVGSIEGVQHVRASQDTWLDDKRGLAELAESAAREVADTLLTRGADKLIQQAKEDAARQQRDPRVKS
ncbi:MAG: hydroxymethylbilane synthase [Polyangiales bacterium]